jgi:hypothetical protein
MYRYIQPDDPKEAPLRMLFQPEGGGVYFKACEADSWRGLVAALLDDPSYETADLETQVMNRLRLAEDVVLLAELEDHKLQVADHDGADIVNVRSNELFIRSLDRVGFVSLPPEPLNPAAGAADPRRGME